MLIVVYRSVVVRSSGKAFITSPAGVEEVCGYGILLLVNLSVECGSGVWHKYACAYKLHGVVQYYYYSLILSLHYHQVCMVYM